jgi:hypothetical protein
MVQDDTVHVSSTGDAGGRGKAHHTGAGDQTTRSGASRTAESRNGAHEAMRLCGTVSIFDHETSQTDHLDQYDKRLPVKHHPKSYSFPR